ncbi:hypothetical protein ACVRXQ_01000 [Streptococcus panodentis]|uniref:hypothetical protein n=1 Tax=Streptococcus panodentis TaxID=1581472 RepID=UPI001FD9086E|nr:hypothetical protein [Streptococcus panodentis]
MAVKKDKNSKESYVKGILEGNMMSDWDYFWRGLIEAFSWRDGQDNVLIGGAPSWTYLLGLFIHFLIAVGIYSLFFLGFFKDRKETGA